MFEVSCDDEGVNKSRDSGGSHMGELHLGSGASDGNEDNSLVAMTLYLHRVKGLVLALLVEPPFLSDSASMEEVVRKILLTITAYELSM